MPELLIQYIDGTTETRKLSRKEPLSIGKHSSNDIVIDSDGVATLHCRIAWNKKHFEVVAAGPDGLDVDGVQVRHAVLEKGTTLRVGNVDFTIANGEATKKTKPEEGDQEKPPTEGDKEYSDPKFGLSPISEEELPAYMQRPRDVREKQKLQKSEEPATEKGKVKEKPAKRKSKSKSADEKQKKAKSKVEVKPPPTLADGEIENTEGLFDEPDFEDQEEAVEHTPLKRLWSENENDDAENDADADNGQEESEKNDVDDEERTEQKAEPRWKSRDRTNAKRPGEQELLKSPFVLVLGGVSLILFLAAGTYSFLILRSLADNQFKAAETQREQGNYGQAKTLYKEFLSQYPRHALTNKARIGLSETRIESEISGSANRWAKGLEELTAFIEDQRARDDFESLSTDFATYAGNIAVGAAKDAGRSNDWTLLDISGAAQKLFERYAQEGVARDGRVKEIATEATKAENKILKFEFQSKKIAEIDAAMKAGDPRAGFQKWRDLVLQYPELKNSNGIQKQLDELLSLELSQFRLEDIDRAARNQSAGQDPESNKGIGEPILTIATRYRSRTDTKPNGEVVFIQSQGLLVALESMTGKPLWEKGLGERSTFFPMVVNTIVEGVLVHNSSRGSLVLLNRKNGEEVWEQPIDDRPIAKPLVHQAQLFVPTKKGIYQIDLNSGRLRSCLTFPQPPSTTPTALPSGDSLVVPAEEDVIYTLKLRPMECVAVTYTAHSKRSISHPLMRAGKNVIASMNDRVNRTRFVVYQPVEADQSWTPDTQVSVDGACLDPPLLRGNRLFVPTRPERLSVFSVADDPAVNALTQLTTSQIEDPKDVPVYLAAGPDDQIWMNSSALRNYQLTSETLAVNPKVVAAGFPAQPLQFRGTHLFVGRTSTYSSGTILTQMERSELSGLWRTNVGAKIISVMPNQQTKRLVVLNDLGEIVTLTSPQLSSTGFIDSSTFQLEIPNGARGFFQSTKLSNGTLAVTLSDKTSQLWILNSAGQLLKERQIKGTIELPPMDFDNRLLVAKNGSIELMKDKTADPDVQPFQLPLEEGEPSGWVWMDVLSQTKFAALNEVGELSVFELRKGNASHIARIVSTQLGTPSSVVAFNGGKMAAINNSETLNIYDDNLEIVSQLKLPSVPNGRLWVAKEHLFVTTTDGHVQAISVNDGSEVAWSVKNTKGDLSGTPTFRDGTYILTFENGTVISVDAKTGREFERRDTIHIFDSGPIVFEEKLVVTTKSGQLVVMSLSSKSNEEGNAP